MDEQSVNTMPRQFHRHGVSVSCLLEHYLLFSPGSIFITMNGEIPQGSYDDT